LIEGSLVIDMHGHSNSNEPVGMIPDRSRLLLAMDRAGIDMACVFHSCDGRGNDVTARYVEGCTDRLIPFAFATPTMGDDAERELRRTIDDGNGFRGIKVYPPSTPWPLHDDHWHPIYRFADERSLVVLLHTGPEPNAEPKHLMQVALQFPGARFVVGHSGNVQPQRDQAIAAARAYPNVFLETSSTFREPGVIETLVSGAGADRVLFGSDQPLMDPRSQLGRIVTSRLADEDKRKVLGENARRLLDLP